MLTVQERILALKHCDEDAAGEGVHVMRGFEILLVLLQFIQMLGIEIALHLAGLRLEQVPTRIVQQREKVVRGHRTNDMPRRDFQCCCGGNTAGGKVVIAGVHGF